jgi:hypothetical protein
MHQVGSMMWTSQWRDGVKIADLGRVEFWTFDHQTSEVVNIRNYYINLLNFSILFLILDSMNVELTL